MDVKAHQTKTDQKHCFPQSATTCKTQSYYCLLFLMVVSVLSFELKGTCNQHINILSVPDVLPLAG